MNVKIYAVGEQGPTRIEDQAALPPLKALLGEVCARPPRRIDRFIQLALIGAARCAAGLQLDPACAVYLTSGNGDMGVTTDVLRQMYLEQAPPKPLSFINTVSNAACFYVAQALGLRGRSQFVVSHDFPFESVLRLALLDLRQGRVDDALLGTVDECTLPLAEHRQRVGADAAQAIGEGSHWLYLSRRPQARPPLAEILAVRLFAEYEALLRWLDGLPERPAACTIAGGHGLPPQTLDDLQRRFGIGSRVDASDEEGYYATGGAARLLAFLNAGTPGALLHIDHDGGERYGAYLVQRCPPPAAA